MHAHHEVCHDKKNDFLMCMLAWKKKNKEKISPVPSSQIMRQKPQPLIKSRPPAHHLRLFLSLRRFASNYSTPDARYRRNKMKKK